MDKTGTESERDRQTSEEVHEGRTVRKCIDEDTPDLSRNPHVGEDPGLLELTEDPRERRLKRHTM
jgi:hypothetical protein